MRDSFVRPTLGDVLVIPLIYTLLQTLRPSPPLPMALGVLGLACLIELSQALQLLTRLGLADHALLRIVLGATFDPHDLLAYLAGCLLILLGERHFAK